jgi:hypothetical protein
MSHASAEAGGAAIIAVAVVIASALRVAKIHLLRFDPPDCY